MQTMKDTELDNSMFDYGFCNNNLTLVVNPTETNNRENLILTDISYPSTSTHVFTIDDQSTDRKTDEAELRSLLSTWKQEGLLHTLIAQSVFVDVLKVIKRHHVERLLKDFDLGTQIVFENNLEQWRESIGAPLSDLVYRELSSPPSPASSSGSIRAHTPSNRLAPYEVVSPCRNLIPAIRLADILNETTRGHAIVEYYNKYSTFQEEHRSLLISLIAQYFEEKSVKMTLAASHQLEREILERFTSEKLCYYRTSKRGKLYTKFNNLTSSFKVVSKYIGNETKKETGINHEKTKYRSQKLLEPEIDSESCIRALKFDNLTTEEFDNTWKACSQFRLQFIRENGTLQIMEKWPFYKNPSGYRLIEMDFRTAFQREGELLDGWEQSYEKILSFLTVDNHIKDKNIKGLLEELKNDDTKRISINGRNAALIWAIHGYLVPTTKVVLKDAAGKKSTTKFTIKDSQESVIFVGKTQQEVEERIEHLKRIKISVQPSVYCIGKDIFSIEEIFLYFDDIRYKFQNVIRAVDICFKLIYVFNLEFPQESTTFYEFLEQYFFKIKNCVTRGKTQHLCEYLCSTNN